MNLYVRYATAGALASVMFSQGAFAVDPETTDPVSFPEASFSMRTLDAQTRADISNQCTRYENILRLADSEHFNGDVAVPQQTIAEGAYRAILDFSYYRKKAEAAGTVDEPAVTFQDPETEVHVESFTLGSVTYRMASAPAFSNYQQHCSYLAQLAVPLAKAGLDLDDMFTRAINGALDASRDPHTNYMDAERYAELREQTRGEFGGLGIEIKLTDGLVEIITPMQKTPAEEAGLMPGDRIVRIDGVEVKGMTLSDAVDRMRGLPGTNVTVSVLRGENPVFDQPITRAIIVPQGVRGEVVGERRDSAHIRINTFNDHTSEQLISTIETLADDIEPGPEGKKRLVIDMRRNPGGLLTQAKIISDLFIWGRNEMIEDRIDEIWRERLALDITAADYLERSQALQEEAAELNSQLRSKPDLTTPLVAVGANSQEDITYSGDASRINFPGYDIVVLLDQFSASASEIVGGALQDFGYPVVGRTSYGKGSVQTIIPVDAHGRRTSVRNSAGALKLTTQAFFPGSTGLSNQGSGIVPNVEVRYNDIRDQLAEEARRERSLERALVSTEQTRAAMQPAAICNLIEEFAGALSDEEQMAIPEELQRNYSIPGEDGKSQSVIMLDADLACALEDNRYTVTAPRVTAQLSQ